MLLQVESGLLAAAPGPDPALPLSLFRYKLEDLTGRRSAEPAELADEGPEAAEVGPALVRGDIWAESFQLPELSRPERPPGP